MNGIPNLEYALVEELIRQEEIDGESLLMLTQVHFEFKIDRVIPYQVKTI